MARRSEDPQREERIETEIVVDAYGPDERSGAWFCYLEDRLDCPFDAECVEETPATPLKLHDRVTVRKVIELARPTRGAFFAQIEWDGRPLAVPLSQLRALDADEDTTEALEDWHYWIARGYGF